MAEQPVKYQQVYEKDLFDNFIKSTEEALKTLNKLNEGLKDTLKETQQIANQKVFEGDLDSLKRREKAIDDNRKAVEGLDKIEKERLRLEERLKNATDERAKANASLRLQIQEATRQAKENAKIEGDLGPYAQKSATLNKLRKAYKDLAIQYGTNSKEARELLQEVQDLDKELKDLDTTVGQNQRRVGDYKGELQGLKRALDAVKGSAIFVALTQLVQLVQQNETGLASFQKALAFFTATLSVSIDALVQAFTILKDTGSIESAAKAFEGFADRVQESIKATQDLVDADLASIRAIAGLNKELAKLIVSQAKFQVASEDSTLSLEEQQKALGEFQKLSRDAAILQLEIATREESLARQRRDASAARRKDEQADAATEQALAEASLNRAQAEAELNNIIAENARTARQNASDEVELQLDVLQDAAERQRNIRNRLINDERISLKERQRLINLSNEDTKSAFNAEIQLITQLNKERLLTLSGEKLQLRDSLKDFEGTEEKRKQLTLEALALQKQARNFSIDSNALISQSNTVLLNEELKQLGLTEAIRTRIIQSLNDRRDALQENKEAQDGLTESQRSANEQEQQNILTTRALFDLQQEGVNLNKVLQQLEKDRLQAEIDALQQRLLIAEKGSTEALSIQAQLNEKLLQQQQDRITKQTKAEQEAVQALIALGNEVITRRLDAQDEAIDRELQAVQRRQDQLRAISEQGRADAEQALAFEQRREAELLRQQEQQQRRRARLQLAISAVETYSSKVNAGDENALASTIRDISFLQAFVASLPAFYEGAENVGDHLGMPKIPGATKDPYLARLHGGERVVKDSLNAQLPRDMSNEELVMAGLAYREPNETTSVVVNQGLTKQDLREVMFEAVKRMPEYRGLQYDPLEESITQTWKKHNQKVKRHTKTGKTSLFN